MKKSYYLIIAILLGTSSVKAQNTAGTEFWLTFGSNSGIPVLYVNLQIRIVSGNQATEGKIEFTQLGTEVPFNMGAQEVFTYNLDNTEKEAVYNNYTMPTTSSKSIHITTEEQHPVTVYALNQVLATTDATNILPVEALSTDYYQISYTPLIVDAYAIVVIENNTNLYHNGTLVPESPFNAGDVYYKTDNADMTGSHITADHPIAFFAVNQFVKIPNSHNAEDCLFQQLAPVKTWGTKFFVPVSNLAKERVRIVASQNGTNITQTGGTFIFSSSGTYTINAGEYIELEINLANNG
jgi:hypothetical protein